jgi:hypothetical protein
MLAAWAARANKLPNSCVIVGKWRVRVHAFTRNLRPRALIVAPQPESAGSIGPVICFPLTTGLFLSVGRGGWRGLPRGKKPVARTPPAAKSRRCKAGGRRIRPNPPLGRWREAERSKDRRARAALPPREQAARGDSCSRQASHCKRPLTHA